METMGSEVYPMKSNIQRFYEDKTIFLTGGTGFLGKVLIEKLLHSCPNIRRIYMLVREKKGMSVGERLKKLLECEVFARLKHDRPEFSSQLTVVQGDLSKPLLGLCPEHIAAISHDVQVIIHSAATLRFDEHLGVAIMTNVSATKQLCLLAQKMPKLEAFVYVSTAYCNCDSPLVQEKVTHSMITPENLIKLPEVLDSKTLDEITPILLGSKPNTYLYTKCAAEEIIDTYKRDLPVAVFRPSIVLSAVAEPLPGWIDNVLGPTGMTASLSAGLLHTALFAAKAQANFVPVDYTVNAIIALAYSVAQRKWENPEELRIVNFVSKADNTITWGEFGDLLQTYVWQNPTQKLVWYPFAIKAQNHRTHYVLRMLLHRLPAIVIDWLAAKVGRPTRLQEFYNKLDKYSAAVTYFSTRGFKFEETNTERLWQSLEPDDQRIFPFDMGLLCWDSYMRVYVQGCRKYLLKDDPTTLALSRKRIKLLYALHLMFSSGFFYIFFKLILFVIKLARNGFKLKKSNILQKMMN